MKCVVGTVATIESSMPEEKTIPSVDIQKQRFNSVLAVLIDFIEKEAKYIDEERRGVRRVHRTERCSAFLKQLIEYFDTLHAEQLKRAVKEERKQCLEKAWGYIEYLVRKSGTRTCSYYELKELLNQN